MAMPSSHLGGRGTPDTNVTRASGSRPSTARARTTLRRACPSPHPSCEKKRYPDIASAPDRPRPVAFPARVPHDETGNPPDDASLEGLARPIRTSITKSRQWGTLAALIVTAMVTYEVDGRVAVITIRRPEARNAVNGEVANGIESAIDRLE